VSSAGGFAGLLADHAGGTALERLVRYAELVERWSEHHNLVSFSSREELVERHILDALAASKLLEGRGHLLDVGSGAGLPGVPLLAVRPKWTGVLLEPRQKRWAFLRTVVRELGLGADVARSRYQDLGDCPPFDLITSRAVGDHGSLLEWARGRLAEDGEVVIWTTVDGEAALEAVAGWRVLSSQLPGLDCGRLARLQPCFT
jgi:16S rRNA (guanine527-N7)-methyltransferase